MKAEEFQKTKFRLIFSVLSFTNLINFAICWIPFSCFLTFAPCFFCACKLMKTLANFKIDKRSLREIKVQVFILAIFSTSFVNSIVSCILISAYYKNAFLDDWFNLTHLGFAFQSVYSLFIVLFFIALFSSSIGALIGFKLQQGEKAPSEDTFLENLSREELENIIDQP